jgi:hypothetical protein
MSVFHIVGGNVLSRAEVNEHSRDIAEAFIEAERGRETEIELSRGPLRIAPETERRRGPIERPAALEGPSLRGPDFTPIGLGKPLTILIRHVYTGQFPKKKTFGGKRQDMALVSGLKDYSIFDASSRALNILEKDVGRGENISRVSAFSNGTQLVAYSPAVITDSMTLSIEFSFDGFPDEVFGKIAEAFGKLAGLPIFLPYAGHLMIAGAAVKFGSSLLDKLYDGRPEFSITQGLDFNIPGSPIPVADFRVLCGNDFDPRPYRFESGIGLIDQTTGQVYQGDHPYVVISLDGRQNDELKKFAPTLASSAILERFFGMKDNTEVAIDAIVDGLQLFNDSKYRVKADQLKNRLDGLPDGPEKAELQLKYDAYVKNIISEALIP